ncbi:hypothetical protein [Alkalimonas amylolytica]|uniref:Porin n=1 Tax=Alkalimonas amylolytica TaxID=152573 RepID=A0A1H3XSV2_ALKAM|nr:hypothetical protein [Alkalimonas amylolytica]SEA01632.1 hypothetical protein SAMN04488051_101347 [Alkalimonas amylolytica]
MQCTKFVWVPALFVASTVSAVDFQYGGFLTVGAGTIIDKKESAYDYEGFNCPCFISDFNTAGLYERGDIGWKQDTRLGLQGTVRFQPGLSLTAQGVARGSDSSVNLEWLYLSYDLTNEITLQVGRKRIPLYYYSDFQDVGLAYIWARPTQALYGWEASNYNGASVRYATFSGHWEIQASAFAGNETVRKSGFARIYDEVNQDIRWRNILGADLEVTRDWFTARVVYLQSDNSITDKPDSADFSRPADKQRVFGLALNADFNDWLILSEFNTNTRKSRDEELSIPAPAMSVGVGRRIGAWTPFINYARFWEKSKDADYENERFIDLSATLRYDITSSSAFKFQINRFSDRSEFQFVGATTLLSANYNLVF